MKCVGTAVGKTLPTVEREVVAKVNKALEGKVKNAKEAMEFFAKHPKEVYTPPYKSPVTGTTVYYERDNVGVIKNVLKTDGTKIDAHFLGDSPRAPLTVFEKTKTGSEIMHTFPPKIKGGLKFERASWLTTPEGNMYGFDVSNGQKKYYQCTNYGWEKVEAGQEHLKNMYDLNTYIARNGYPKANL